jgi:hypothetical protein
MSKGYPCPNCKEYNKWGHYVPPSLGEPGFFICKWKEKRDRPEKKVIEVMPGVLREVPNEDPIK